MHRFCGKAPLVRVRQEVGYGDFRTDGRYEEAWRTVERVGEIGALLQERRARQNQAETTLAQLAPWQGYDLPLSLTRTGKTQVMQGSFPISADPEYLRDSLAADGVYCEFVGADERFHYAVLICHRDDEDKQGGRLAELGFLRAAIKAEGETPAAQIESACRSLKWIKDEQKALQEELVSLAAKTPLVEVLSDIERTTLTAIETRSRMAQSQNCVVLSGWVPVTAEKRVAGVLDRFACAWEMEEPSEEDDVPILLRNNPFAVNFEWVLGMYSYPKYGTFDPTFIMSIFYFIIFGLMFADVGYGLLLVVGCFGAIALLKPKPGMKRFLAMFGYCGFSSIIWGVILGSYFGDLPKNVSDEDAWAAGSWQDCRLV